MKIEEVKKDCSLIFSDGRPEYEFSSDTSLRMVLDTAKERDWPLLAIRTPNYVLSILTPEDYDRAVSDSLFTNLGV